MATVLSQVQEGNRLGGLARRERQSSDATFQGRHTLFEHVLRRVHDARVDIAEFRQAEEIRGVLGVTEHVTRRLIDGNRASARSGVGHRAGVHLARLESILRHVYLFRSLGFATIRRRQVSIRILQNSDRISQLYGHIHEREGTWRTGCRGTRC